MIGIYVILPMLHEDGCSDGCKRMHERADAGIRVMG